MRNTTKELFLAFICFICLLLIACMADIVLWELGYRGV